MRRLSVAEDVILGDLGSWDVAQVSSCDDGGGGGDDDAGDADEPLLSPARYLNRVQICRLAGWFVALVAGKIDHGQPAWKNGAEHG